ncbi:caspase domain-containing protein [Lactarius indigo]|nr:caspase domain-containing protein [Lactarius indigo]
MKHLLKIDIAFQPPDFDFGLPAEELLSSAVHPPVHLLVLENERGLPQNIEVHASDKRSEIGVTIEDVLKTLNVYLRKPPGQRERAPLNEDPRRGVDEDSARAEEISRFWWRWIDYLRGRNGLQIFPKHPLPGEDDRISRLLPHNPTSNVPVLIRLPTLISDLFRWPFRMTSTTGTIRLPDDEEEKSEGPATKRRALLVGISYKGDHNTWSPLDGPHEDVDRFQQLLIDTYGYRPEDITILKDDPNIPDLSHPTRVNMICELKRLVSDAAPGDTFVFLYSGHSDQKLAIEDSEEDDNQDEMIITSDEECILDKELNDILILLPIGCSLLAILDTCHSGTLLDLPHHHCNSVYVPWQSKGTRRTLTIQNNNVRRQATDSWRSPDQVSPSIGAIIDLQEAGGRSVHPPSRIDDGTGAGRPANQRESSPASQSRATRRPRERLFFPSAPRTVSPEPLPVCDGWCDSDDDPYPAVLSLSACSDLQRAWEGPNGSLTTVVCNYLKTHSRPSYRELMSHINFQLHDNALELHKYTRYQKKKATHGEGDGFDGELDNFQEPLLSSLAKLVSVH